MDYARQSVEFADRCGDWGQQMINRTTLADALHQAGELAEAEHLFQEAEAMQRKKQPEYPYLYSLPGFRFCDLLLSQGQYQEVQNRIQRLFEWRLPTDSLLAIALENLSLGRALMLQAQEEGSSDLTQVGEYLNQAVAGLREAGVQDFLTRGLLARAAWYQLQGDYSRAWDDLREAREIAERGSMGLFLADYHLEASRLCEVEVGKREEAEEHRQKGRKMVGELGYGRRSNSFEF